MILFVLVQCTLLAMDVLNTDFDYQNCMKCLPAKLG